MSASHSFPEVKFLDPQTLIEPYETYQMLRDEAPVYLVEDLGIYMVTRYDLLRDAIKDTKTFSSKFDHVLELTTELPPQLNPGSSVQASGESG